MIRPFPISTRTYTLCPYTTLFRPPLGLPNSLCHALTVVAPILTAIFGARASFLPARPRPVSVSVHHQGELTGRFALLMVTTLERLLLNTRARANTTSLGALKLMVIEEHPGTVFRALWAALAGRLGRSKLAGIHVARGDEIRIEGDRSSVILGGELLATAEGRPIVLKTEERLVVEECVRTCRSRWSQDN